jgi:hypothetical protein
MLMFNFFVCKEKMLFKVLLLESFMFFLQYHVNLFLFFFIYFFWFHVFPYFSIFHSHDEPTSKKRCFEMFVIDEDFFGCF